MYALLREQPSMGPQPRNNIPKSPYPAPAPVDYTDEVTDEHLARIDDLLADEFEGEDFEVVSGPAW